MLCKERHVVRKSKSTFKLNFELDYNGTLGTNLINFFKRHPSSAWILIKDQDFSSSYDLAPPSPHPPLLSVSSIGDTQRVWERETACWWEGRGEEVWRGAKSYDAEKACRVLYKSLNNLCRLQQWRTNSLPPFFLFHLSVVMSKEVTINIYFY
jgi:hypothetical protein